LIVASARSSAAIAGGRVHRRYTPASETRRVQANGYNFDVDSADRTVRASGELRLQPTQRRSPSAQRAAGKPDRLPQDHGGHFVGRQFGGPEIRENHFAQNARFNQSGYRRLEDEWKGFLRSRKRVSVDVRAQYSGGSRRPSQIDVTYYVNGERKFRRFPNEK
jgi:predicted ribonuclease toxin of YeeF-YezG toxin-antitoxin module